MHSIFHHLMITIQFVLEESRHECVLLKGEKMEKEKSLGKKKHEKIN